MTNAILTRRTIKIPLEEFGETVDYIVEYYVHDIGAFALNRIWPVHSPSLKRGGHQLTWEQRGNIMNLVFNRVVPQIKKDHKIKHGLGV